MSEREIARLLALVEKAIGREWIEISDWLRSLDANSLDAIEARLVAYDYDGVVQEVEAAAKKFAAETHQQFIRSGRAAAKWLDDKPELDDRLIRFDVKHDRAILAAERNELELVRGLTDEVRQTAKRAIADGQVAARNPRAIARDIRGTITLTPHQAQHVLNLRRELEEGDFADALRRELRDRRSDKLLRRLAREGGSLTPAQIDKLVARYEKNYRGHRAETVARTEGLYNVHAGMFEGFQQAIDRGDLKADELVKEWIPGPRTRHARIDHRGSFLLDQRPAFNEPFVMEDGTRMQHPGDRNGGAKHNASCRCTVAVTLAITSDAKKRRIVLAELLKGIVGDAHPLAAA